MKQKRVVVAMSGGVDSSVAAALLKEAGYEVIGITMRLWSEERPDLPTHYRHCCSVEAIDDARRVCQILGIPFYVMNFERRFQSEVVDYFCHEYRVGRTPNPCLVCNQRIKFDFLLQEALALEADYLATGHYARIDQVDGKYRLLKARDTAKDQSYALFTLGQEELQHLLFPLGDYRKAEVRCLAAKWGLPVADKADSQEICFIPDNDYHRFLRERLPSEPGEIFDSQGRRLGTHQGIAFYTVGQRHGLGLASGQRLYVTDIDAKRNSLVVGPENELCSDSLWAYAVSYISGEASDGPTTISAKIRYRSPEAPATLLPQDRGALVSFDQPQRAITPGQAVVFYRGESVLGGGIIEGKSVKLPRFHRG
ncbi:MAG: tRNA 2-thiouridine(34) synthase MnmA [Chloroflexi bacterium RBG_13_54_9]|nr:MAG: tRNA 2-thiouridine(34) synthase MnmA [Chloroflexi bacterium RBG_13_54_9]